MGTCTWWGLRNCLKCQARQTSRQTVRWPTITLLLPEGPYIAVRVDYFGPLPVTPRGNTYQGTSCFSLIVPAAEPTSSRSQRLSSPLGTRLTFSSTGIFPSGDARAASSRSSDNGLQFCSKLSYAVHQLLGFGKLPPAPTPKRQLLGWNVSTTRWPRYWQWLSTSSLSSKTTGMNSSLMSKLSTTIQSAPPWVWLPMRGPYGSSPTPPSYDFRVCESPTTRVWPATTWPTVSWRRTASSARTISFAEITAVARVNHRISTLSDALRPAPKFDVDGWP